MLGDVTYTVDLSAYLARIGLTQTPAATVRTLHEIALHHVQSIPFENLDILLNRPISLEPSAIEDKLVHARRGGYCFEHNTLLRHVLEALCFEVTLLSARARYRLPPGVQRPRTHVLLRVDCAGQTYLLDGGFGGLSPTAALRLQLDVEQTTPHAPRRLVSEGKWDGFSLRAPDAVLVHQAFLGDGWPLGRVTLQERELTFRERNGAATTQLLSSHYELLEVLRDHFQLRFPSETRFEWPALAGLA
jgi:N-hydroxyarylamine O-acetyltransferase